MLGVDETSASVSMSGETLPVVSTLMSFGGSPGSGVLQSSWENLVLNVAVFASPEWRPAIRRREARHIFRKAIFPRIEILSREVAWS